MAIDSRRTVVITGTSSGIGASLVRQFLSHGLRVFATARNADSIGNLKDLGAETFSLTVDDAKSVESFQKQIAELTKDRGLDYLVNNAGKNYTVPALDVDLDELRGTFETNFIAPIRLIKLFAPQLIKAKGTIVQIGSITGYTPYVFGAGYNASKAALHVFSDTMRVELEPFGVRVITVVTGGIQSKIARTDRTLASGSIYRPVNTEYLRRVKHSQEGAMPSDDYAKSVVSQVLADRSSLLRRLGILPRVRYIWEGNKSWLIWFVLWFLPIGTFDWYFKREFGLWKLNRP